MQYYLLVINLNIKKEWVNTHSNHFLIKMTDKEKTRIEKFLEIHFGNLELSETRQGLYKSLGHKDDNSTIFLIEETNSQIFVDTKKVIDPIFRMFNTDYTETYDFVKNWLLEKYNIESEEIIGAKMII